MVGHARTRGRVRGARMMLVLVDGHRARTGVFAVKTTTVLDLVPVPVPAPILVMPVRPRERVHVSKGVRVSTSMRSARALV